MPEESDKVDRRIAAIAGQQHGVVAIDQLLTAGLSHQTVSERARAGRLHRLYRGVYAVGHRGLPREGRWMAAVLAHGEGAVLSHRSAAELWRLLRPASEAIDVSVPTGSGRSKRAGIRLHRCASLTAGMTTQRRNIPVTTPAQTLADLEGIVPPAHRRRAVRQAEVLGLRTGLAASETTRSELEHLFLRLCERHGLPKPEVNVRVGPLEVDFLWRAERLIVETDGYKYHRGAQAYEDDHQRDFALRVANFDVLHFTFGQVAKESDRVAALIHRELERSGTARTGSPTQPDLPAGQP